MNSKFKTIVSSFVIGGLMLTAGSIVFANNTSGAQNSANDKTGGIERHMRGKWGGPMGGKMGDSMGGQMGVDRQEQMDEMVTAGILTQDQADAIKKYEDEQMQTKRQEELKSRYDSLVSAGVITLGEEDKILAYCKTEQEARQAEMEKVRSMSEDERKAYFESKKDSKSEGKTGSMSNLVEAGILTQEKVDSINAYFEKQMQAERSERMKTQLDSLVSGGTITQAQEDEIITLFEEKAASKKAEMDRVKSMTEDERKAYFESIKDANPVDRENPLKALVDGGTLTQAQADAASKALHPVRPLGLKMGMRAGNAFN